VNVDAIGKSYHRIRRQQIRITSGGKNFLWPRQRPVRLFCNGVAFVRFGRLPRPAPRDERSVAEALGGGATPISFGQFNESAMQFDPCYRDGRMLDRSARHRSF
jgi:hypothetical protein